VRLKSEQIIIVLIVALPAIFAVLTGGRFLSTYNVSILMERFAIFMLVSLGGTFVIVMGSLDISYTGVFNLAGYMTAIYAAQYGPLAIIVGLCVGLLFGGINGLLFTKARIPSLLVTLGTLGVSQGIVNYVGGGEAMWGLPVGGRLDFLLPYIFPNLPEKGITLFAWAVAATLLCFFIARFTKFGLHTYAIGSNEEAARLAGINVDRHRTMVFVLSALLAALAGILNVPYAENATAGAASGLLFITLATIVMGGTPLSGGRGGPHRTIIGVYILVVLLDGLTMMGVGTVELQVIEGIVLILAMLSVIRGSKTTQITT